MLYSFECPARIIMLRGKSWGIDLWAESKVGYTRKCLFLAEKALYPHSRNTVVLKLIFGLSPYHKNCEWYH